MLIQMAVAKRRAAPSATDYYEWYPSLDLNTIPFHTGAGFWGAQSPFQTALAPQGALTEVNVATAGELTTALTAGSRRITLTADIDSYSFTAGNITDVDIIIPSGRIFSNIGLGRYNAGDPDRVITRLRIRGSTVGSYSGGQLHRLQLFPGPGSADFIIDGVGITGTGNSPGEPLLFSGPYENISRVAMQYNRIHSGGICTINKLSDFAFCGNSVLTGSQTGLAPGSDEAYAIRHYPQDRTIIYGNDIRSDTARTSAAYSRLRFNPDADAAGAHVWASNNTIIERIESHVFWLNSQIGNSGVDAGDMGTIWFEDNLVICTGGTPFMYFADSDHARVNGNTFQSDTITSVANISADGGPTPYTTCPDPVFTQNTYEALPGSDPAWGAAGDPSALDWTP